MPNPTGAGRVRDASSSSSDAEHIDAPNPAFKSAPDVPPNWQRLDHVIADLMAKLTSEREAS
jgi:hypothetical protein